jgi:hypothetical protein
MLATVTVTNSNSSITVNDDQQDATILVYNQQDATLHNLFISVKCCICFRRFLRPSSGAQNCIYVIGYLVEPSLLPAAVMEELELTVAGSRKGLTKYPMLYVQF